MVDLPGFIREQLEAENNEVSGLFLQHCRPARVWTSFDPVLDPRFDPWPAKPAPIVDLLLGMRLALRDHPCSAEVQPGASPYDAAAVVVIGGVDHLVSGVVRTQTDVDDFMDNNFLWINPAAFVISDFSDDGVQQLSVEGAILRAYDDAGYLLALLPEPFMVKVQSVSFLEKPDW